MVQSFYSIYLMLVISLADDSLVIFERKAYTLIYC